MGADGGLAWLTGAVGASAELPLGLDARGGRRARHLGAHGLDVTGDPLHSLHATSELADDLGRVRGLQHVPGSFVSFVGRHVRPPVALLAPIGVVLAWRVLGWRRCACRSRCSRRA